MCTKNLLCILFILLSSLVHGNGFENELAKSNFPVIIGINKDKFVRVPPPKSFLTKSANNSGTTINVDYNNFPPEAKAAFDYAVSIWKSLIVSAVPINIVANWMIIDPSCESNVLGTGGSTNFIKNEKEFPRHGIFYNIPLAEKLLNRDLNAPGSPDIYIVFNAPTNWYFGIDGQTPSGQYDFVTVALHELCHGLGFIGSMKVNADGKGEWGYGSIYPFNFDQFVYNGNKQQLIDQSIFENPSSGLLNQMLSNDLYFDGPVVRAKFGDRVGLYAPETYIIGSSIDHLSTNFDSISPQLMAPVINTGTSIHDPGLITMSILADLGWENISINHKPIDDTELIHDIQVSAILFADFDTDIIDPALHYKINEGELMEVGLQQISGTAEYIATIPITKACKVSYCLTVSDKYGRKYGYPNTAISGEFKSFEVGPDIVPPVITHLVNQHLFNTNPELILRANVEDDYSIDTVYVEYSVNGVPKSDLGLMQSSPNKFNIIINFACLKLNEGDFIDYRIVARDASNQNNMAYHPAIGYHKVTVSAIPEYLTSYETDFETNPNEFEMEGFGIKAPEGFTSWSMHSEHPYRPANHDEGIDYTAELLFPIKIADESHYLTFDGIPLVEPGIDGAVFGQDEFNDYVVVEGSIDGGLSWIPFKDGWDCRVDNNLLNAYNQSHYFNNFDLIGGLHLFQHRYIDLSQPVEFEAGDVVRIRFRLHSANSITGWGWAIDNLMIQTDGLGSTVNKAVEPAVYPNPVTNHVITLLGFDEPISSIKLMNTSGQLIYQQNNFRSDRQVDFPEQIKGLFILLVESKQKIVTVKLRLE